MSAVKLYKIDKKNYNLIVLSEKINKNYQNKIVLMNNKILVFFIKKAAILDAILDCQARTKRWQFMLVV